MRRFKSDFRSTGRAIQTHIKATALVGGVEQVFRPVRREKLRTFTPPVHLD